MRPDPEYLSHSGRLATLKNFLCFAYHQDVWDLFDSDEAVWNDHVARASVEDLERLVEQLEAALALPPLEMGQLFAEVNGLEPESPAAWLQGCLDFMQRTLNHRRDSAQD